MRSLALLVTALLATQPAIAQDSQAGKVEARLQFKEGLAHAQRGDFNAALKAFEAAYAAQPHYSVLYNIAQAQAASGRNIDAVASFERYLNEGGSQIADARREAVRAAVETARKSIGSLKITVAAPDRTRVWLDGLELQAGQLAAPITLSAGKHRLLYSTGFGYPITTEIDVSGADTTEFRIAAPEDSPELGELEVTCLVPGLAVMLDHAAVATTPLSGPLAVPSGTHRIGFVRPGYRATERAIAVSPGELVTVDCEVQIDPQLAHGQAARLTIQTTPVDARVLLNGRTFAGGVLPVGPHDLHVERDGYLPYRKTISLVSGKPQHHQIVLHPTRAKRIRDDRQVRQRRTLSYLLGGTGLALLATSGAVLLWNQKRYDDWRSHGAPDMNRVASIQRGDDASLGLAILGTGLALGGAWTFLSSGHAHD